MRGAHEALQREEAITVTVLQKGFRSLGDFSGVLLPFLIALPLAVIPKLPGWFLCHGAEFSQSDSIP